MQLDGSRLTAGLNGESEEGGKLALVRVLSELFFESGDFDVQPGDFDRLSSCCNQLLLEMSNLFLPAGNPPIEPLDVSG